MKKTTLIHLLQTMGIQAGEFEQPKNLYQIILDSDGNQFYNRYTDFIKFDTTNELVKIKKYFFTLVGGRLLPSAKIDGKEIVIDSLDEFGGMIVPANRDIFKEIRQPKVGDAIYLVDADTMQSTGESTTIKDIKRLPGKIIIEVEDEMEYLSSDIICFRLSEYPESAVLFEKDDHTLPILYTPQTKNAVDIYLSFDCIAGFEFKTIREI